MTFKLIIPTKEERNTAFGAFIRPSVTESIHTNQERETTMSKNSKKSQKHTRASTTEETPGEAFSRLATGRTNKAVKAISLIAQLTGTAYKSTGVQQRAILEALQASLDLVKDTFEGKAKAGDKFRLPSG